MPDAPCRSLSCPFLVMFAICRSLRFFRGVFVLGHVCVRGTGGQVRGMREVVAGAGNGHLSGCGTCGLLSVFKRSFQDFQTEILEFSFGNYGVFVWKSSARCRQEPFRCAVSVSSVVRFRVPGRSGKVFWESSMRRFSGCGRAFCGGSKGLRAEEREKPCGRFLALGQGAGGSETQVRDGGNAGRWR